jgi:hypothetical protein
MKSLRLTLLVTGLWLSSLAPSFGLAGDLTQPSLAFPKDAPYCDAVMKVVMDKSFKFLRGYFVNADTTLEYSGDAASLNAFLAHLAACAGVKVSVSFSSDADGFATPEAVNSDAAWTLRHNAWGDGAAFHVIVNTRLIKESAVAVPKEAGK